MRLRAAIAAAIVIVLGMFGQTAYAAVPTPKTVHPASDQAEVAFPCTVKIVRTIFLDRERTIIHMTTRVTRNPGIDAPASTLVGGAERSHDCQEPTPQLVSMADGSRLYDATISRPPRFVPPSLVSAKVVCAW